MKVLNEILRLIYPVFCQVCDFKLLDTERHICDICLSKIILTPYPYHDTSLKYLKKTWSWGIYENTLKKAICLFKYNRQKTIIHTFEDSILEFIKQRHVSENIDLIVPVPLHKSKIHMRTFNQAEVIATVLSKAFTIRVSNTLLKCKKTPPQYSLTKKIRSTNLKDAFKVKPGFDIKGKKILLIDDILTTGATLSECAKTLRKSHVKEVTAFTLARVN